MQEKFDRMYKKGQAKWTRSKPPSKLVKLVESGEILPCRAFDVGCGEGYYSGYLDAQGFIVTGADFSPTAIEKAKINAPNVDFRVVDVVNDDLSVLGEFGFVLEWALRHNLPLADQNKYTDNLVQTMKPGTLYLSTNFSILSDKFGEPGERERSSQTGFPMTFMPLDEQINNLKHYFHILEADGDFRLGKYQADYLLLKRK